MRLTLEHYGQKVTMEIEDDDASVSAVIEKLVRPAILALGYAPESIESSIGTVDERAWE